MPRGGPRPNSGGYRPGGGRPKGSKDKKNRNEGVAIAKSEKSPLSVMRDAMEEQYRQGNLAAAAAFAKDMAPYCHARLTAMQVTGPAGGPLQVVYASDFYANGDAAPALAAPAAGPVLAGPVQAAGLRPEVGENGAGPDRNGIGPRPPA